MTGRKTDNADGAENLNEYYFLPDSKPVLYLMEK